MPVCTVPGLNLEITDHHEYETSVALHFGILLKRNGGVPHERVHRLRPRRNFKHPGTEKTNLIILKKATGNDEIT